jgi:hypothetical protein
MSETPDTQPLAGGRGFTRSLLGALGWAAIGLAVGWAVRFLAIEPEAVGRACLEAGAASWGCALRQGLIALFHFGILGGIGAAAGLYAVFGRKWRKPAARTALVAGGLALALYNAGLGAVAAVLGLLAAMEPGDG